MRIALDKTGFEKERENGADKVLSRGWMRRWRKRRKSMVEWLAWNGLVFAHKLYLVQRPLPIQLRSELTSCVNVVPPGGHRKRWHEFTIERQGSCHERYCVGCHLQFNGISFTFTLQNKNSNEIPINDLHSPALTSFNVSSSSSVGTLSKTPSVATRMTSPSLTGKLSVSADSGLSLSTLAPWPGGGSDNWNGVLK